MSQLNESRMSQKTVVIVFPSVFSLNKISYLVTNISKILKIKKQLFTKIRRDGSIIVVEGLDPGLASSTIGLFFGIDRIANAMGVSFIFNMNISTITESGMSVLMRGTKFYVKV